ncbi:hypothetical protein LPJ78_004910 [Coemansia sp. RSA 989]|nr:hypothetical protein LPJ78_004910 [Coemansia sp. RSA 989]
MYKLLELKPDSALINPQFDGYKLRLIDTDNSSGQSAIRHYELSKKACVEPHQLASNALLTYNEMYSRVHYNHLFTGPNEHSVIYIDSSSHVYLVDVHKRDAPVYILMFKIPPCSSMYALQGYHGAYAIGKDTVLIFDGMFTVYVLQHTGANGQAAAWQATGMFEIGCGSVAAGSTTENTQRTMYYLCDSIIADESVWTLENGRLLTFYLQKEHEGARWSSVFKGDDGVMETIDPSEFVTIRERLEKYTANEPEVAANVPLMQPYVDQDSGGDPEQQEQVTEDPTIFSVRSWSTGLAEASSVVGSPDWLCPAFSRASHFSETPLPPVCLKFDVDGVVFAFHASPSYQKSHAPPGNIPPAHSNVCARHASTFSALSYVQASKREKRFMYIDSDMTVAVLAEAQRRIYIYHQSAQPVAIQNIVDLGSSDAEIFGIQLIGRTLVVLRKHLLTMVDLDLC